VIESAGISTISLTVHPYITAGIGVPRAISLRFPQGNIVGEPGNVEQQTSILLHALNAVASIEKPNTILVWPYRWRSRPGG
jgi:D-proline reductase (dithiol) PrdB